MISKSIKNFCKKYWEIENYVEAVNDTTQTWHCHHIDEIRTLPSGMTVIRSAQDLKDAGRYYDCPANELIFLTAAEHRKIHKPKGSKLSEETKQKISEATKGKPKEYVSDVMHREWDDPDKREARIEHMNEAADRRRIHTDITARQLESPEAKREYMREYQRKYRQLHPNYYKNRYRRKKGE